jgi:asparagine synthase (glutamine-hydrolysing)
MCGIVGVFGRSDPQTVGAMLASLVHRGPDDGFQVGGVDFTMGVRRLSIVDVAHGRQPLSNERGTVWACQNGELYNFPTVRPELEARGHQFVTRTDTELIPHLYEEYGSKFAVHLDGMFAVAVWDDTEKRGVLVRDRMGKKPLYYWQHDGALYFASELKALLRIPGFERRINLTAVHHYLSYKNVPNPSAIFEGVSMLPPAHQLLFRPGHSPVVSRYWAPDFSENPESSAMTDDEIAERLTDLLRQSVRRRLMSDVPIGFFLSGGIDSSLLTALAAEQSSTAVTTFTLTYGADSTTSGKDADRTWARWVAERYATDHHEEIVEFGHFPDTIQDILRAFDEPFAGTVSTFFLSRLIARHVKVALSGDGADELFGSYRSHRLAQPEYLAAVAVGRDPLEDWAWRADLLVLSEEEKADLYAKDVMLALRGISTTEHLRQTFSTLTAQDPLNRILEAEFGTLLPDQVLTFVDRLSMAHSVEIRAPFLDTRVVEFVSGISGWRKLQPGHTKRLLKNVAAQYFPDEMVHRPKEGFVMPLTDWILAGLEDYVRDTLSAPRLARHGLFRPERVHALVDRLYRDGGDHIEVNKVLVLLLFQEWHDLYM